MQRFDRTDSAVPGPVQSGLYRQVVLLYRWSLIQVSNDHCTFIG